MHRTLRGSLDHDAAKRVVNEMLANVFVDDEGWDSLGLERFLRANALHHS